MTSKSSQPRVYLSPPHMSDTERGFVTDAFDTNWIAPVGPHIEEFERELAEDARRRSQLAPNETFHVAALSSGTAAIHLGLIMLGVKPGDVVLCSSFTFAASANPIRMCGAEPFFIDSDPADWNMSVTALRRAIRKLADSGNVPRACIAVSLYGQAAEMTDIVDACAEYDIPVIDEAAESIGATISGRASGTFGALGIWSFNGNKIITTSGGGALVSNNPEFAERARYLATQARDHSPISAYEHSTLGFNYRMSNVLAGIGRGQLQVLDDRIEARRQVFDRYRKQLGHIPEIQWMPELTNGRSTRWLTCATLNAEEATTDRDSIILALQAQNIEARPLWKPMHRQQFYQGCGFEPHEGDVSTDLFDRGFCLPSGSSLKEADQNRIIELVSSTCSR